MDNRTLEIYLREVVHQVEGAVVASGLLKQALEAKDIGTTLGFSQNFMATAASLSKLLWTNPSPVKPVWLDIDDEDYEAYCKHAATRSKSLRKVLKVTDSSPLKSRKVRNSLEHFDERLDAHTFAGKPIVDRNWGPLHMMPFKREDILRHFDPQTLTLTVLSESVSFPDLIAEMSRVGARAQTLLNNDRR
ncbi:hypothetical protein [Arthrobacter sp. UYCu712]|uniref:hypothetical protein n=1 Tax=Arthrobacter sp. UYCu712 TaxID=3156340 RepID=UPI003394E0F1